jgi:hypothetical protein
MELSFAKCAMHNSGGLSQPQAVQDAGHLGSDLCRYEDADGPHFFIRVLLEVPIPQQRPFIVLEESAHALSVDFHEGISVQRSQNIAEALMHGRA